MSGCSWKFTKYFYQPSTVLSFIIPSLELNNGQNFLCRILWCEIISSSSFPRIGRTNNLETSTSKNPWLYAPNLETNCFHGTKKLYWMSIFFKYDVKVRNSRIITTLQHKAADTQLSEMFISRSYLVFYSEFLKQFIFLLLERCAKQIIFAHNHSSFHSFPAVSWHFACTRYWAFYSVCVFRACFQCVSSWPGLGPYLLQPYARSPPRVPQCNMSRWIQDGSFHRLPLVQAEAWQEALHCKTQTPFSSMHPVV